ncbi:MAG TPA: HD domain-containing phosphohydrolase [Geopsychrobacteraceae bacterium]|nr:HD domain-containing phosphohydrolase [Geopsychrobacteraceae bacterium]
MPDQKDVTIQRLEELGRTIARLAAETASNKLPESILSAALKLTGADAGTLYLQLAEGTLCCEAVQIVSQSLSMSADQIVEYLPLVPIPQQRLHAETLLLKTFLGNRTFLVDDIEQSAGAFVGQHSFDRAFNYKTRSLLSVPLNGLPGEVYGVIKLMSPLVASFTDQDRVLAAHLAANAGSILIKNQQIEEQKALFESMIQMIAGAVDEKFCFGTDHCRRVPAVTMMLARAVNRTANPPFARVTLDQQDLYALEVAAWLHDCGKLLTPVSLLNKSRKLETVFDRIDLIQTRFEIVRRDEEIARLRAGLAGEELPVLAEGKNRSQQMLEDLHFLTACNHGKKNMTQDDLERIEKIEARYRWIDRQMEEVSVLSGDEKANLSIEGGTLNERERVKVNNHKMATISMLDLLPFPQELQLVPEIITCCYQGRDEQKLLQARILAIADIFVSVTAENCPYRKTNSLEGAITILFEMGASGQLDLDLLDLFVSEHLHQQYAAEFLTDVPKEFSPSR